MDEIKNVRAKEILDSRGVPTVEVCLSTDSGSFKASVPAGVSRGVLEAIDIRDGGERYNGQGVKKAVSNVNDIIAPKIVGLDPAKQQEIDQLMLGLDNTQNKAGLGANAILPVSIAIARAGARAKNAYVWEYVSGLIGTKPVLPKPCALLIEGGLHSGSNLSVQEFMVVSAKTEMGEQLEEIAGIWSDLAILLEKECGRKATNVGLEGGFAPLINNSDEAINIIVRAIGQRKAKIVLDVAATHLYKKGKYLLEKREFDSKELCSFYANLAEKYPILGIEDPFAEEDWAGWKMLKSKSEVVLIGDDLTVTNRARIEKAGKEKCLGGVVIKPNQIGTVTETIEAVAEARKNNLKIFVKHRSGETNDDFLADLAVGLGAEYIMAGALNRGERIAKYNRLLDICREIG